jgi:hypothetical protein
MAIDVRARMICNLGQVISGQVGDDLLSESGLIRSTGTVVLDGLAQFSRGTLVELAYERPQLGTVTRFPRRLRVLRSTANPYERTTTLEVGCKLALKENLALQADTIRAEQLPASWWSSSSPRPPTISAQDVLTYCLDKVGIPLASGSETLRFQFLRAEFDLSSGYVATIGKLLISHCCYGTLNLQEELVVRKVELDAVGSAPVVTDQDVIDLQPIAGGEEPADRVTVSFDAIRGAI